MPFFLSSFSQSHLHMPSPTEVASRSARSVRKLYRSLLRTGRKWPVSESRKDRSLWEAIPRVTRSRFELLKTDITAPQIKTYGVAGVKELEALQRLESDLHFKTVRKFPFASFPLLLSDVLTNHLLVYSTLSKETILRAS